MTKAATALPKSYRLQGSALYFTVGVWAFFGVALLLFAFFVVHPKSQHNVARDIVVGVMALGATGLFFLAWISARYDVVLHADRVESLLFRRRRLNGADIAGYRRGWADGTIRLFPKDKRLNSLTAPDSVLTDGKGLAWVDELRDFDAADLAAREAAVLDNSALGATPAERQTNKARVERGVRWLNYAAWALLAWGWFWPAPYRVVIIALALAPLVALGVTFYYRPLVGLDDRRGSKRPSLILLFLFPAVTLALRALLDVQPIDWSGAIVLGAAGGVAMAAAMVSADPELSRRWFTLMALGVFAWAYAFGALTIANAMLDDTPARPIETTVREKLADTSKVTTYKLTVGPWGDERADNDVTVSRDVYEAASTGDKICVYVNDGRFGWRWYFVQTCGD